MVLHGMEIDPWGQTLPPKKVITKHTEDKELTPWEIQKRQKFFNRDLLTLLEQGPIKKIRKTNNIEKIEEQNTPEMEAQIREIFWENYEHIIH